MTAGVRTIFSDQAAAAAHVPSQAVIAERHAGVREAIDLIKADQPGRALYVMVRSVQRQARIAGCGIYADDLGTAYYQGRGGS